MKKTNIVFIAAFAAAALFMAGSAVQAEKDGKRGACREEIKRICGDIEKGEGRIRACVKEKKDQLSAECQTKLQERMDFRKKVREACKEDHKKFCKGKRGKEGRQCMIENQSQFSAGCQAVMQEARAKRKNRKER